MRQEVKRVFTGPELPLEARRETEGPKVFPVLWGCGPLRGETPGEGALADGDAVRGTRLDGRGADWPTVSPGRGPFVGSVDFFSGLSLLKSTFSCTQLPPRPLAPLLSHCHYHCSHTVSVETKTGKSRAEQKKSKKEEGWKNWGYQYSICS